MTNYLVGGVEADHVLEIQQDGHEAVELVGQPKVREPDKEKGRAQGSSQFSEEPKPGLMNKRFGRIEEEQDHGDGQGERICKRRYAKWFAVEEGEDGQSP